MFMTDGPNRVKFPVHVTIQGKKAIIAADSAKKIVAIVYQLSVMRYASILKPDLVRIRLDQQVGPIRWYGVIQINHVGMPFREAPMEIAIGVRSDKVRPCGAVPESTVVQD